jgi:hypothetical protein
MFAPGVFRPATGRIAGQESMGLISWSLTRVLERDLLRKTVA